MSRVLQHIAGLVLAAGLMTFAAFQYNAQVVREDLINQEIVSR
ncbi:hypothetical protein [Rhizobium lentis]|nr:hypothetical protein [Rhizobium lentis]